jgi:hypothetical protein
MRIWQCIDYLHVCLHHLVERFVGAECHVQHLRLWHGQLVLPPERSGVLCTHRLPTVQKSAIHDVGLGACQIYTGRPFSLAAALYGQGAVWGIVERNGKTANPTPLQPCAYQEFRLETPVNMLCNPQRPAAEAQWTVKTLQWTEEEL